jgi:hypothetical protein
MDFREPDSPNEIVCVNTFDHCGCFAHIFETYASVSNRGYAAIEVNNLYHPVGAGGEPHLWTPIPIVVPLE